MKSEEDKKKSLGLKKTIFITLRLYRLVWDIDKKIIVLSIVVSLIAGLTPFIGPFIFRLIINFIIASIKTKHIIYSTLFFLVGMTIVSQFASGVIGAIQGYIDKLIWTKIPSKLNAIVLEKTATLDIQQYENSDFKNLLEKVRESYEWRPQNLIDSSIYVMQGGITLLTAVFAVARLNVFLVIGLTIIAVPQFFVLTKQSKFAWGIWDANVVLKKRYWYISEILQKIETIKEIKLFDISKAFLNELDEIQTTFTKRNVLAANSGFLWNLVFNVLNTLVSVGIELYVIIQAILEKITIGDITFYMSVIGNFQSSVSNLFRNMNSVFDSALYVSNIFEVLDAKPVINERDDPIVLNSFDKPPVIEFRNVTFAYPGSEKNVFEDFSLVILPGQKIAFVGENGAGKSTMIKLLARFYDVTEGEILVNGVNIKDLSLKEWYRHLGILFQDFNRYDNTIRDNIHFGRIYEPLDPQRMLHAAASSGAREVIENLEGKYDQMLGKTFEKGTELSTGQWQKLALARAFYRNAPILVLDEPTAAIDAKAEADIFNRVEHLSRDKTVIIISHRFSTVRNADKIYVVDNGKIVESGSHTELIHLNGRYAMLFKLQARGYQLE